MTKITEFETVARRKGPASLNDHLSNYFDKTGKAATFLKVRSLRSQVSRALKDGGELRPLVKDGVILPSQQSTGRVAEWSEGISPVEDKTAITIVPSDSEKQVAQILANSETNGYGFQFPETSGAVSLAMADIRSMPVSKQQSMATGLTQLDFERRMAIKDTESQSREIKLLKEQVADKERINELLTASRQNGEGTAVAKTR